MYGSPPVSKDLNLPYPPPASFGSHREDDSQSDLLRRHRQQQQQQQQQQQMSSGLLRFRSAPSSLVGEICEDFLPAVRPSSPETETMFARFLGQDLRNEIREKPSVGGGGAAAAAGQRNSHFAPPPRATTTEEVNAQHMMYHSQHQQQQQMPNHSSAQTAAYQVVGSMSMDAEQIKNGGSGGGIANSPNLVRQSSSPAGLFSHLNEENGYGMMRGIGGFRNGNNSIGDAANRLKSQISLSSRQNSLMSQISEMGSEGMDGSSPEESSGGGGGRCYIPGFPVTSWEQTSLLPDNTLSGMKRGREGEGKIMAGLNSPLLQNGEVRNHVSGLTHQFSLPKTSSEMAAIEKFLQFNETVPCKVRAKRGCATHPRSIAERVRRTRISERMRKLQELVPNMDKQTNTADMLDLAVDYIKDLQRQVKTLNEGRASCTCSSSKQKPYTNC